MLKEPGSYTVWVGPMRSAKSRKLIEAIKDHERAKLKVLTVKSPADTRDGDKVVAKEIVDDRSTVIMSVDAHFVNSRREIMRLVKKTHCEVFAADEVEFFKGWFLKAVLELAFERKMIVLLAGLDLNAWREPFGIMPRVLTHATYVHKCLASCFVCGRPAQFTQKTGGNYYERFEPGDFYEARCFRCHVMPEDLVAESLGASIIKASTI